MPSDHCQGNGPLALTLKGDSAASDRQDKPKKGCLACRCQRRVDARTASA
ncbi:hypothetical protein ACFPRL_13895 [Pseudoclavibacter helvolus]